MGLRLRQLIFCAFLVFLVLSWNTVQAATGYATIIDLTNGCDPQHPGAERATLAALLGTAGYSVTQITTGVVPADLTSQEQVWDIRCQSALTSTEMTTYTAYLASGGSLFLIGENTGYGASRDASLISYIANLGGGSLTLTSTYNSQTVQAPFSSGVSTVLFRAIGGTTSAGSGAFITRDINGYGGAIVFGPGSLSAAANGTLMIVWDINFLDNDASHTAGETTLTNNLIAYLANPTTILSPGNGIVFINGTLIIGGSASSGGGASSYQVEQGAQYRCPNSRGVDPSCSP
jgi:hypothetical protein